MKIIVISYLFLTITLIIISCEKINTESRAKLPSVRTSELTVLSDTSAQCGGSVISDGGVPITARGVCWSPTVIPTISNNHTQDSTGVGNFKSNISGLIGGLNYNVRAYATNKIGTSYGEVRSSKTFEKPSVTTGKLTVLSDTSVQCEGSVISDGGIPITARGVCWSPTVIPTISNNHTQDSAGVGNFKSNISGLIGGLNYNVRAYATNKIGTSYGEVRSSKTFEKPSVLTGELTLLSGISAQCEGTVISDGGVPITARGVCWSPTIIPTLSDNHTQDGAGIGTFTSIIWNLTRGLSYNVRAYATNRIGTSFGEVKSFKAMEIPVVYTQEVSYIAETVAKVGGGLILDGGDSVTARGICWSTDPYPTILDDTTKEGNLQDVFVSTLTDLSPGTRYIARAYATNSVGTGYGQSRSFITSKYVEVIDIKIPTLLFEVKRRIQYVSPTYSETKTDTIELEVQCSASPTEEGIENIVNNYSNDILTFSYTKELNQVDGKIYIDTNTNTIDIEYNYSTQHETINLKYNDFKYQEISDGLYEVTIDINSMNEYMVDYYYYYHKIDFFGYESSAVWKWGIKLLKYSNNNFYLKIKNKLIE